MGNCGATHKSNQKPKIDETEFSRNCLKEHNYYRRLHGAKPLTLDNSMSRKAKKWAKILAKSGKCICSNLTFGENVAKCNRIVPAKAIVDQWYSGEAFYRDNSASYQKTGHFTQVVWMASANLGVGVAGTKGGGLIVVAYYDPAGNIKGKFESNVKIVEDQNSDTKDTEAQSRTTATTATTEKSDAENKIIQQSEAYAEEKITLEDGISSVIQDDQSNDGKNYLEEKNPDTRKEDDNVEQNDEVVDNVDVCQRLEKIAIEVNPTDDNSVGVKIDNIDFDQDMLIRINTSRANHGSLPLTLDNEMQGHAQRWAEHMAADGRMSHIDSADFGENIAFSMENIDSKNIVNMWYDESANYNFQNQAWQPECGHFTQMVWSDSWKLGVGKARADNGAVYVCTVYAPKGNFLGQFGENVFRPGTPLIAKRGRHDSTTTTGA